MNRIIIKNTTWLFAGQFIGRALRAGIIIYAARVLGAASWGAFSYTLSVAAFLTIFSDVGINALLTREVSKKPEAKLEYLSTAFFIKIAILTTILLPVIIFRHHLTNIPEAAFLIPIIIFVVIFDALRDLGASIARAMEKMEIEAIVNVLTNTAIVILGFIFLKLNPTSQSIAIAYALGAGFGFLAIVFSLRHYFRKLFSHFRKDLIRPILTTAWPFGVVGLMAAIMINTDILILGWLRPATDVGFYAAAQRPIQLLYIIPTLIATAFFPSLVRFVKIKDKFKETLSQSLKMTFLFSAPMTLGGIILAPQIIDALYGPAFGEASLSFLILVLTLIIVFPSVIIVNAIFAHNRQKDLLPYAGLGIFGNAALDLFLIPIFGIVGCALATLISQAAINIYAWLKIQKISRVRFGSDTQKIWLAAFLMAGLTILMKQAGINFWLNLFGSGLVYVGWLLVLRESLATSIISSLRPKNKF